MLDAEEEVVVVLALALVYEAAELLLRVLRYSRVAQVVLLHPHRIQDGLVLPRLQVPAAEVGDFEEGFGDEFVLDALAGVEVLLDFVLGLEPQIVLCAEVNADLLVLLYHFTGKQVQLHLVHHHHLLYLLQQPFCLHVLLVLVLEQLRAQLLQLLLRKQVYLPHLLLSQRVDVEFVLLHLFEKFV